MTSIHAKHLFFWIMLYAMVAVLAAALSVFGARYERGVRPILRKPPEDIARVLNTTGMPLTLAPGLSIHIFADGLGKPRDLAFGPGGEILASIPEQGKIVAFRDGDSNGAIDSAADAVNTVVEGLDRPHGILFDYGMGKASPPEGYPMLLVAEERAVSEFGYDSERMVASKIRVLATLPSGGRHQTRSLTHWRDPMGGSHYLLSVGSSCNECRERDDHRAAILEIPRNGGMTTVFARGLRNAVFLAIRSGVDLARHPHNEEVWATEMGRDSLGDTLPPDEINVIHEGGDYGWPYCYGKNIKDPFGKGRSCAEYAPSHIDLPAHSAPLGLAFIDGPGWPMEWQGDLLVAFHGSWNRTEPTGYKVVRIDLDDQGNALGMYDFISGWLTRDGRVLGRPVDLLVDPNGKLSISDDKAGVIYRVTYDAGRGTP